MKAKAFVLQDRQIADNAVHEIFLAMDMTDNMLKALNASILFDLEKYHPNTYNKFRAYKNDFLYDIISENLKRGIQEEVYRADLNVDIITRMRLGTTMLSMNMEFFPPGKYQIGRSRTRNTNALPLWYCYRKRYQADSEI